MSRGLTLPSPIQNEATLNEDIFFSVAAFIVFNVYVYSIDVVTLKIDGNFLGAR